jgi:hypothetical protein
VRGRRKVTTATNDGQRQRGPNDEPTIPEQNVYDRQEGDLIGAVGLASGATDGMLQMRSHSPPANCAPEVAYDGGTSMGSDRLCTPASRCAIASRLARGGDRTMFLHL